MAVTTQPRLIKYNNKDYDFDLLQLTVLNNYDKYARLFGYSRSKYEKDRLGLNELLSQMRSDTGATVDPYQITFSSGWGNEKGAFGKTRNKSRHYKNPTWMIIDTLQGMNTYDPNADKKKLNADILNLELTSGFAGINGMKDAGNRKQATIQVINDLLSKYNNNLDNYVLDEGFVYDDYKNKLNALINAINSDGITDDELAFWNLNPNLTNPLIVEESKPEEKDDGYKTYRDQLRNLDVEDSEIETIIAKRKQKDKEKLIKEILGEESSSTQSSSSSSSSDSSSSSSSQNVTAKSSQQQNPPAPQLQNQPGNDLLEDEPETPPSSPSKDLKTDSQGRVTISGKPYKKVRGIFRLQPGKAWDDSNVPVYEKDDKGNYKLKVTTHKKGSKIKTLKYLKKYQDPSGTIDASQINLEDNSKVYNLAGAMQLLGSMLPGWWGKGLMIGGGALGAGTTISDLGVNPKSILRASEYGVAPLLSFVRGKKTTFNPKLKEQYDISRANIKAKYNETSAAQSENAIAEEKRLKEALASGENKYIKKLTDEEYNKLSTEEKAKYNAVKSKIEELENFRNTNKDLLDYPETIKKHDNLVKELRESGKTTFGAKQIAIPLAYNIGAEYASLQDDLPYDYSFGNLSRVLSPVGLLAQGRIGPMFTRFKNWYTDDGLRTGAETLSASRAAASGTAASGAAASGTTTSSAAASTKPSFWSRFKWRKGGSGTAAVLTGAGVGASIPSSSQARTMTDLYSTGGAGDLYYDENGNLRQIGGFTVEQRPEGPELAAWNTNGVRIEPMLQGVTSTGKMDDRLRELRMYIDPKTGRSMIPGVNMWKVLNDPELKNLVDKSGAEFDMLGRYVGEIKPARTDLAYNNPLARAGRRIVADLHGTSGTPSPLTVYPAAALAALGLTAAPWGAIGKGLGTLGTALFANDAIDMLKTNPEVYRWLKNDWNLGNMYLPYNEYTK